MHTSRRDFNKIAFGSIAAAASGTLASAATAGVRLGVCTYSFRDLPRNNGDAVGPVIDAMKACNADICELFSPQLEPEGKDREALRQWRLATPMDYFDKVRQKFTGAGIEIYAYTLNFRKDYTDEELDKSFQQAKALRAHAIASSTTVSMLPRLKPLAEKHKITVAVHGHSDTKHPDEFSSPESFQKALDLSPWFKVNLDIGHFTAANFDAVAYITEHHARVSHLHLKDRKKNDGPNEPFGQGDTPIKEVLRLLKAKRYPIPALIEYEYNGAEGPIQEVKKSLDYCRAALA